MPGMVKKSSEVAVFRFNFVMPEAAWVGAALDAGSLAFSVAGTAVGAVVVFESIAPGLHADTITISKKLIKKVLKLLGILFINKLLF
jgi:hypothetical protein